MKYFLILVIKRNDNKLINKRFKFLEIRMKILRFSNQISVYSIFSSVVS